MSALLMMVALGGVGAAQDGDPPGDAATVRVSTDQVSDAGNDPGDAYSDAKTVQVLPGGQMTLDGDRVSRERLRAEVKRVALSDPGSAWTVSVVAGASATDREWVLSVLRRAGVDADVVEADAASAPAERVVTPTPPAAAPEPSSASIADLVWTGDLRWQAGHFFSQATTAVVDAQPESYQAAGSPLAALGVRHAGDVDVRGELAMRSAVDNGAISASTESTVSVGLRRLTVSGERGPVRVRLGRGDSTFGSWDRWEDPERGYLAPVSHTDPLAQLAGIGAQMEDGLQASADVGGAAEITGAVAVSSGDLVGTGRARAQTESGWFVGASGLAHSGDDLAPAGAVEVGFDGERVGVLVEGLGHRRVADDAAAKAGGGQVALRVSGGPLPQGVRATVRGVLYDPDLEAKDATAWVLVAGGLDHRFVATLPVWTGLGYEMLMPMNAEVPVSHAVMTQVRWVW